MVIMVFHSRNRIQYDTSSSSSSSPDIRRSSRQISMSGRIISVVASSSWSPSSTTRATLKKKVRFCLSQCTYMDPPPPPEPLIENSELYYTPDEYRKINAESQTIIAHSRIFGNPHKLVESPVRGLEDMAAKKMSHHQIEHIHRDTLNAVLNEQRYQRMRGGKMLLRNFDDDGAIAEKSKKVSKWSRIRAKLLGDQDARVAMKVHQPLDDLQYSRNAAMVASRKQQEEERPKEMQQHPGQPYQPSYNKNGTSSGRRSRRTRIWATAQLDPDLFSILK